MLRTLGNLTALKLIGALLGIFYSILQVRYFGTDRIVEVFFAAQSVVYLVSSLTQSGQLAEVYLPIYLQLKEEYNHSIASQSFSIIINRILCYVSFILVFMFFTAPIIMELFIPGFSDDDQEFATLIFRALLPLVLVQIISSFINTVLNAEKIYGRVEVAGIVSYIFSILILVYFFEEWNIWSLVVALYVGRLIDFVIGLIYLRKQEINYSIIWNIDEFDAQDLLKTLFSTFTYTGATQILNWAYTASLSFLPQGTFAIFKYVNLLFSKSGSIIVDPVKTLLFTEFSTKRKENNANNIELLKKATNISIILGILIFTIAMFSGYEGMSLIWGGKKFDSESLDKAFPILIAFFSLYTIQIAYGISRKYVVSCGLAAELYNKQAVTQVISAGVVFLLVSYFGYLGLIIGLLTNRILLLSVPFIMNNSIYGEIFQGRFMIKVAVLLFLVVLSFLLLDKVYISKQNDIISKGNDLCNLVKLTAGGFSIFMIFIYSLSFDELRLVKKEFCNKIRGHLG